MNKSAKETIAGTILTAIVVMILLFVFFSVKEDLQKDASPELNKTLENVGEGVESSVNWWIVGSGIVGFLGLAGWAIWWARDNDFI